MISGINGSDGPLTFARDHHLRRRLGFAESTFEHKAKLNLNWLAWLLNKHTAPGSVVLDPMAGPGSILLAALNQHPTLAGDVEDYWSRLLAEHILLSALWWTLFLNMQPRCSPGAVRRAGRRRNHREIPRSPA